MLLVEEEYRLGGHLRYGGPGRAGGAGRAASSVAAAHENLEVMTNGVVTGRYDDNWLAVVERQPAIDRRGPLRVRAPAQGPRGTLVVAPGLIERPYVFEGNDEPGVLLSTAARR